MFDGKADGCSQWLLSCFAKEKPTARRVNKNMIVTRQCDVLELVSLKGEKNPSHTH